MNILQSCYAFKIYFFDDAISPGHCTHEVGRACITNDPHKLMTSV